MALEAVRPVTLAEIKEAQKRIAGTIVRTPLLKDTFDIDKQASSMRYHGHHYICQSVSGVRSCSVVS